MKSCHVGIINELKGKLKTIKVFESISYLELGINFKNTFTNIFNVSIFFILNYLINLCFFFLNNLSQTIEIYNIK